MKVSERKPLVGILLISPPRFRNLGEGTAHGFYWERKEAESKRLLDKFTFADTIFPGIAYTREDIQKAIHAFKNADVDMVFAHFLSWSDDFAWIRFLRDIGEMPILFASITRDEPGFEDSLIEDRFIEFLCAGGLVGALEASGSIARFQRPMMRTTIGSLEHVMEETQHMAQAAKIRSILRQVSFGLLPSYNEVMWSTYVDPYNLFMKVGPELRFLSVAGLEEEIELIPKEKTEAVMEKILKQYPSDANILKDKLFASVEASLALEEISRKSGVELLVLNDIDQVLLRRIGLRPGFTPCPGTDDIMVVPEGDLGGGLACYILKVLSNNHVNFIEPFHIDKRTGLFAAGHAGPNDYTDPLSKTVISTDARFAKSSYKHAGAPFAWNVFAPGEKTIVHISQCNGRFKMVCSLVDAVETKHFLAGYSHGLFKSRIPVEEFFDKLISVGVTQHYGITAGNYLPELEILAQLLDFDLTII
jgi:L-arabinose isomerase